MLMLQGIYKWQDGPYMRGGTRGLDPRWNRGPEEAGPATDGRGPGTAVLGVEADHHEGVVYVTIKAYTMYYKTPFICEDFIFQ